jgi:uncharacterized protein (TIGR02246 family)
MRRVILVSVLCVVLSLIFVNCGVSSEEHKKVEEELAAVKAENEKLKTEVSTLKEQLATRSGSTEIRETIVAADEKFMAAFNKGDAAGVAALYTENGQLLPPNSDIITGRKAIQAFWQGVMDMGIKSAKLETSEVEGTGDTVSEIGKYSLLGEGDKTLDTGKYVVIWKQVEGQWQLHRDIWNSSLPPPGK